MVPGKNRHIMAVAATVMMFASTLVLAGESWELVKQTKDVSVFSRFLPGFSVNQFRGECLIPAPLKVLERIMRDFGRYSDWFAMSRKVKVVREIEGNGALLYYVIASPWPVADRDVTVKVSMYFDHARGTGEVLLKSVDSGYAPEKASYVRIRDMEGHFVFNRLEPALTRVILTMKVDPLIDMSRTIINGILIDYPFDTLKNLRERVSAL